MYNDDVTRIPQSLDEMWQVIEEQFQFIEWALLGADVETKEDAIDQRYSPGFVIRYRGVSEEEDNLDHYLEMGRKLCSEIRRAIEAKEMSPTFVQQWGMIQFCHGFVASHILDDTDPMVSQRGGRKGGEAKSNNAQRKWVSHIIVHLMGKGLNRHAAEEEVARIVSSIIQRRQYTGKFDHKWFSELLKDNELSTIYQYKYLYPKSMNAFIADDTIEIPPLPEGFPR